MAKIRNNYNDNAGKDAEKLDLSYIAGGSVKCYIATLEKFL